MTLFKGKPAIEVVTPARVRALAGVSARDFIFDETQNPEKRLDDLLEMWIEETASNIRVRLGRDVDPEGIEAKGIEGVLIRTVANLIAVAHQQRSSPIIQIGEFATNVLNASNAMDRLDDELEPFIAAGDPEQGDPAPGTASSFGIFLSSEPYIEGDVDEPGYNPE